jgi:putative ABC transport system permease protein
VTTLTLRDVREMTQSIPCIQAATPEFRGTIALKTGSTTRKTTVSGVDATYATLRDAPIARGRFFSESEATSAQRLVVLGAELATALFGTVDPVGQTLWIRRIPFQIIGVLPSRGAGLDAFDEDETAFIPLRNGGRDPRGVRTVS